MTSLKRQTIVGVFWSIVERFGSQIVTFIISLVLARILSPREFGLAGIIIVFTSIGSIIVDGGFGSALIQRDKITKIDESSVFYFNCIVGAFLSFVLYLNAGNISHFYDEPDLLRITQVMSLNLFILSFSTVPNNLLAKKLDFKIQAKVSIISAILSGIIGVLMAINGYGVWSLVFQTLSSSLFRVFFLYLLSKWLPALIFSYEALKSLFHFGSLILVSGILNTIFTNLYKLIIGKIYTMTDLGYYNKANEFFTLTSTNTVGIIGKVLFPALSKLQKDNIRFKLAFAKSLKVITLVTMPIMLGLGAIADNLIPFLITDKWNASIPYLRILSLMGALLPISSMNLEALKAQGKSRIFLNLEIAKKILMVISIALSFKFGISIMLFSHFLFVSVTSLILNTYYSGKILHYGTIDQLRDLFKIFSISIVMALSVYILGLSMTDITSVFLKLILQIILGASIYILGLFLFEKKVLWGIFHELRNFK